MPTASGIDVARFCRPATPVLRHGMQSMSVQRNGVPMSTGTADITTFCPPSGLELRFTERFDDPEFYDA